MQATPWPSRRAACHQSGNSMHTSVAGLVMLFALTQVRVDPGSMQVQQMVAQNDRLLAISLSQSPKSTGRASGPSSPVLRSPNSSNAASP